MADVFFDVLLHYYAAGDNTELIISDEFKGKKVIRQNCRQSEHFSRQIGEVWYNEDEHRGYDFNAARVTK